MNKLDMFFTEKVDLENQRIDVYFKNPIQIVEY
jgi:hypothetical protein